MRDPRAEGRRWLAQADNDLLFARHALQGEFFHQVCFVCQQCAEKALKALIFAGGARSVIGHSVVGLLARLVQGHSDLEELNDLAAELDLFYIPARYPNGLVEGTPHEAFTRSQAERALAAAERILSAARQRFPE
ncbi:MAG: HEPN domain-containing protein [Acidobacteriota bacterium]